MKKHIKSITNFIIGVIVGILAMLLCLSEALYSVDKIFSDPLYYMQSTTNTNIKIIAIDEKTLEALGPVNTWSREVPADLVEILSEQEDCQPAVIAFDIMYTGEVDEASDTRFAEAARKAGNVVTATNVVWRAKGGLTPDGIFVMDETNIAMIEFPYEELRRHVNHGFANMLQDRDGYIRFEKYQVDYNGEIEKSFASQIYETYCREKGIEIRLPETFGEDLFYFTYSGKSSAYEVVSLVDVLEKRVDIRAFDDCVVLVGAYAPGMMESYYVSVQKGAQMYGVEIHANIFEALLEHKTAVPVSTDIYAVIIGVVAALFYFINRRVKPGYGALVMIGFNVLNVVIGKLLYHNGHVMDVIYLPVILLVIYVVQLAVKITLFNRMYTEALKEQMHSFADAFATAVDERTPYNGAHTQKVAEYVEAYAKYINILYKKKITNEYFDKNRISQLRLAATLHDIGKLVIPKSVMNKATRLDKSIVNLDKRYKLIHAYYEIDVLNKRISEEEGRELQQELENCRLYIHHVDPVEVLLAEDAERIHEIAGKRYISAEGEVIPYLTGYELSCLLTQKGTLNEDERAVMESHVEMTEKILSKVKFYSCYNDVVNIVSNHHEYLNGTGYPRGRRAEELSIECRMLTIADIYDALTSVDRPYKTPMSKEKAFSVLEIMVEEGKLDGQLVKWFEEAIDYFYQESSKEAH